MEHSTLEYIKNHKENQHCFLSELKELLERHQVLLYEEQFYSIWNQSLLSHSAVEYQQMKEWIEKIEVNTDISFYHLLCLITKAMGIFIPMTMDDNFHIKNETPQK